MAVAVGKSVRLCNTIWSRFWPGCRLRSFLSASGPVMTAERSEVTGSPAGTSWVKLEKEALDVLNEIMAKLTKNEKLIGIGAVVAVVGWLLGLLITSSWYSASGAQGIGMLAVAAAVAAIVIIYLKYAPGTNITWPAPLPVILLVLACVTAVVALLGLFMAFTYDPCQGFCNIAGYAGPTKPITLYLAAGAVLVGGAVMAWGAYQDWTASKTVV